MLKIIAIIWGVSLLAFLVAVWKAPLYDENERPVEEHR